MTCKAWSPSQLWGISTGCMSARVHRYPEGHQHPPILQPKKSTCIWQEGLVYTLEPHDASCQLDRQSLYTRVHYGRTMHVEECSSSHSPGLERNREDERRAHRTFFARSLMPCECLHRQLRRVACTCMLCRSIHHIPLATRLAAFAARPVSFTHQSRVHVVHFNERTYDQRVLQSMSRTKERSQSSS